MIEYVYFALVDKRNLQSEVKKMLGKELEDIYHDAYQIKFAYEQGIREEFVVGNSSMRGNIEIGHRYNNDPYNDDLYLYLTIENEKSEKPEKPMNLIVKKEWIERLAISYGQQLRRIVPCTEV